MIKLIIPMVAVMAFFIACGNAPAKRIAECEHLGSGDGICVAREWDFAKESPFMDSDLSALANQVSVQK